MKRSTLLAHIRARRDGQAPPPPAGTTPQYHPARYEFDTLCPACGVDYERHQTKTQPAEYGAGACDLHQDDVLIALLMDAAELMAVYRDALKVYADGRNWGETDEELSRLVWANEDVYPIENAARALAYKPMTPVEGETK